MKKLMKTKVWQIFWTLVMAILTVFSFGFTFNFTNINNYYDYAQLFRFNVFFTGLLGTIFFYFYYRFYFQKIKHYNYLRFLAGLFSLFLIVGYSYEFKGNASLIIGNWFYFVLTIFIFIGYYIFFNFLLTTIFTFFNTQKFKGKMSQNKIINFIFFKHPFISTFLILLICWLPYIISFYPGIFSPDPSFQVEQFFGIRTKYSDYSIPLDPHVTITNHHPVTHTVLLGGLIALGKNLGSFNLGVFFYSILQTLALISLFSYIISYMNKLNSPLIWRFLSLLIYAFVPVFPFYAMSVVKDVYFAIFVIFYIIKLYDVIKNDNLTGKSALIFILLMILITLFRNNGIYLILMSFPFLFLSQKKAKGLLLITLLCPVLFYYSFTHVLLPSLKITPGSIREVLSIPFQQTARYVKEYSEEVTPKEVQIIDQILDYSDLAKRYKPNIADPVKNKYNKYATTNDLKEYFKVWWQQFRRHPQVYIDATIANTYGYFYPDTHNWYIYHSFDSRLVKVGFDYHYNSFESLRTILENYGEAFPYIPGVGLIVNIAIGTWICMFIFICLLIKKKYRYLIYLTPVISLVLVCIASPVNTYFRYTLGYMFAIPIIIAIFINIMSENKKEGVINEKKDSGFNSVL